jgi:hypothetical protein
VLILAYALGLPYGPVGVASGFSTAMFLLAVPVVLASIRGTPVSPADVWQAVRPPLYAILVASGLALLAFIPISRLAFPLLRLALVNLLLFGVYFLMLFFVLGQKALYLKILRGLGLKLNREEKTVVPREMCV